MLGQPPRTLPLDFFILFRGRSLALLPFFIHSALSVAKQYAMPLKMYLDFENHTSRSKVT